MISTLNILSLNCRGVGSSRKLNLVLHELNRLNYDIFLLQETHVSCKQSASRLDRAWKGKCFWSFGTGKSAGVATLLSPKFSGKILRFLHDSDGRILSVLVDLNNIKLNIVNIYAPNTVSDRKIFFEQLHDFFLSQGDLLIGGDFNCTDNVLDKFHSNVVVSTDKNSFKSLMNDFSLVDTWRRRNPRGTSFTWYNSDHTLASRIDRFLISKSLFPRICSNKILPCSFSDHDSIELSLSFENLPSRRNTVWKFNNSLLYNSDYKTMIVDLIENNAPLMYNYDCLAEWWDNLKNEIRNATIKFSISLKKKANLERNTLTKEIIRAKNAFHSGLSDGSEIKNAESKLLSIVQREAEGAKIRSRAQWIEEGEKPTRYFFRLEKKRAEKNNFASLFDQNGIEKTSQNDLENILVNFYTKLYSKDSLDMQIQTHLIDDLGFSLTDYERDLCEGLFTEDELLAALKGLQTGKSPGSDGLPTEFYVAFWDSLRVPLISVFNECFRDGSLTPSQREGIVRLIHKKDDVRDPKNWRPISLLNTDYKLASKVITERLKKVMSSIVHQDQTCGVVGRTIFSNLHLIRDILDMIDKTNEPAILVTLDQEKAFDRVDHNFLMRVLSKFGFGPSFCRWVEIFYNRVFSRIIVNDKLSSQVFLDRGVRQGCPLSPLLYVLVSEVLSTQVRNCNDIEGFLLPGAGGLQSKISQYADDATSILKSEKSLSALLKIVHKFELGSGAKLNTSKSEAMWLGKWRNMGDSPFGLKWVNKIRILGVYFSNGLLSVDNDNWQSKLDKLSNVLNLWKQRDLSFVGKALIVNVLGASKLWHVAKVLTPPSWMADKFKSIIWPFIWNGKIESVSRQRCCAPIKLGGLNVVDFATKSAALRLSNFQTFRDSFGAEKWHYLARYFLGNKLHILDNRFYSPPISCPSSAEPTWHYKKCLLLFRKVHTKSGKLPDDLSCKNIYDLLLDLPSAAPRCAGFWLSVVGRPINRWAWVWRKSRLKLIENRKNDLLWLILHRAVRVRYSLKKWGYIDNDKCALCRKTETLEHCFLECPRVVCVWNFFSPLLSRLYSSPFSISSKSIFFPLSEVQSSTGNSLASYLIATILFYIWFARNRATFHNSVLSSEKIRRIILCDIQNRIRCESDDTIENFWSFRGVLCSLDNNKQPIFS